MYPDIYFYMNYSLKQIHLQVIKDFPMLHLVISLTKQPLHSSLCVCICLSKPTAPPPNLWTYLTNPLKADQESIKCVSLDDARLPLGSTYSWSKFCTPNCPTTASNYQLSHLRSGQNSNSDLRGGRQKCYHSVTMAPAIGRNYSTESILLKKVILVPRHLKHWTV